MNSGQTRGCAPYTSGQPSALSRPRAGIITGMSYCGTLRPLANRPLHAGSLAAALASWLCARMPAASGCCAWTISIRHARSPAALPPSSPRWRGSGCTPMRRCCTSPAPRGLPHGAGPLCADGHAFACWCSRSDLAAHGGIHRDACVSDPDPSRRAGLAAARGRRKHRFRGRPAGAATQDLAQDVGDFVLLRADGYWGYHLACVVDDAHQGVTEVVRGADLLESTPRQILLQHLLGLPTPRYLHIPLVRDGDGNKLSKSEPANPLDGNAPLPALRAALNFLGLPPDLPDDTVASMLQAALRVFDPLRLGRGTRTA